MGLFSTISSGLQGAISSAGASIATGLAKKYLPPGSGAKLGTAISVGGSLLNGDLTGAQNSLLNSGLLLTGSSQAQQTVALARFLGTKNRLLGGLTPIEAKRMLQQVTAQNYSRKNLFLVEVTDLNPPGDIQLMDGEGIDTFNFFVTEIDYAPVTVTGDRHQIGSASIDGVKNSEPSELRVTTLDSMNGEILTWARAKALQATPIDGTVGVPADYLIKFRILHAYINEDTNLGGYEDTFLMRVGNTEVNRSRREDAMQEIQMTFVEFDTYFKP